MKSKELEWRLKRSKDREKRLKELNAPQAVLDAERRLQYKLYLEKVIGYGKFVKKFLERVKRHG